MNQSPHVLFVCLGNICRSPCAQVIFEQLAYNAGLVEEITADSCGTAAFNNGKPADPRAVQAMGDRAYLLAEHVARQICEDDFLYSTHIMAMDWATLTSARSWAGPDYPGEVQLLQEYNPYSRGKQIPDPYYRNEQAFHNMVECLENACTGLFQHICQQHSLHPSN